MAKISDIVSRLGIPATTLRYYDREGLIPSLVRTQGGIRSYNQASIARLIMIHILRQGGMSILELKELINLEAAGDSVLARRDKFVVAKLAEAKARIEALEKAHLLLEYEHWRNKTAIAHGGMEYVDTISLNEVPEKFHEIRRMLSK